MSNFSEEAMFECLEQTPPKLTPILGPLTRLFEDDPETAEAHAKLIRLTLVEKKAWPQLVGFYEALCAWYPTDREWRQTVLNELGRAFAEDPVHANLLEMSGMSSPRLKAHEGLRRLRFLSELVVGDYVFMKNFGFGEVKEVRQEDRRVIVDFINKPDHEMELSFAAEKMVRITKDHLYAIRYLDPERMETMVKSEPGEVIRIALKSFGPTAAPQLQSLLVPEILPEKKWKTFWTNARKDLKKDSLVILPSKRSEPLELLSVEKSYDAAWFRNFGNVKNMVTILNQLEEFLEAEAEPKVEGDAREAVIDRLTFVVIGAEGKHYDYLVRCWLIGEKLDIGMEDIGLTSFLEKVKSPEGLLNVVQSLSASLSKSLLAALSTADADAAADVLYNVLPQLEYSALNEAIQLLSAQGHEDKVATALRPVWNQWTAEVDVMFWLSQNPKKITEWNFGSTPDLVARILKVINRDYTGNRLRVRNQLRETFRKPTWLKQVLGSMDERQRRAFTQGVKDSTAWEQLDKASVLGQIVKLDSSVQDIVSGKAEDQAEVVPVQARISSIRSFREKEAQLQKIIQKDIPENSKDIALARSYGDLRENFEYKAAKDTQKLLMGRRAELEVQLREVKPSDFSEFVSEVAGIATTVTIKHEDGSEQVYHIGGEWDSNVEKDILSNGSGMAKALQGKKPGETATVPSENGELTVEVVAVKPLADNIRIWLASEDGEEA
jgi:transcription elongation GreA/GreB family factor